jgi:hypothetical protein
MDKASAPTLSQHLMDEANRFIVYPVKSRRTRLTAAVHKKQDAALRRFLDWRKTFVPREHRDVVDFWSDETLMNQAYCRELLTTVPAIVERTLTLRSLTLTGISDAQSLAYLREAANSYILGLPLATVALCRAAVERALKQACAKLFGAPVIDKATFDEAIERFAPRVLSKGGCDLADIVRKKGNEVLHPKGRTAPSLPTSLEVLEATRDVLQALH